MPSAESNLSLLSCFVQAFTNNNSGDNDQFLMATVISFMSKMEKRFALQVLEIELAILCA